MKKPLIIVESPAKISTLKKFFGNKFDFASSVGHIRDLPEKEFGIDIEHDFEPKYINLPSKKDVIKKLKDLAKKTDLVYLCPDPDREGEAIAWHISQILPKSVKIKRVTFNSYTKSEILNAIEHPRQIDLALVDAQQARRLLDRIVGYKISPILSKTIKRGKGTSAGRVQSVALKFVVDRENEIRKFKPTEFWKIDVLLNTKKNEKPFEAFIYSIDGKKLEKEKLDKDVFLISNKDIADKIIEKLKTAKYKVESIDKKEKKRYPSPPFITSTLQQEASRHFGFSADRTMNIAQTLYEGVDLKAKGFEGIITYMRTDSVNIANEPLASARNFIDKKYGKKYLPEKPIFYKSKKSAQEAHEAIRPTNLANSPDEIEKYLTLDQYKLYSLIWKRFIASQMQPAIYDTVSADITTDKKIILRATGSNIKFDGFLKVYVEKRDISEEDEDAEKLLPQLEIEKSLNLVDIKSEQSFTKPPARYTEASLIKELEKSGIGRPSTYASIMKKIQSREYTIKEKLTLKPTELGELITQLLEQNFAPIVNAGFTAAMEDDLELVAEHKREWKSLIKEFYSAFIPMVEQAAKEAVIPKIDTDKKCPKCGSNLQKIWSKSKYFYGCSKYPTCDFTSSIEMLDFNKKDYDESFDWNPKCPVCTKKMVIKHGRFGIFLGCSDYPKCKGIINVPKKGEKILDLKEAPACPALGCDGKIISRRSRKGKIFYSCSNFPDCDVIVNSIDDLNDKYDAHHPKTAYQRKEGFKGGSKNQLYVPSDELKKIVGKEPLTRSDLIKSVWKYIKAHKLQDAKNKRIINPDKNLSKIFSESIDMMKLSTFLNKHIKRK